VEWITRHSRRIASLPRWIHQAYAQNDWQVFAEAGINDFPPQLMGYAIRCAEKWASYSPAAIARYGADSYLLDWSLSQAERAAAACRLLPPGETPEGEAPQPAAPAPVLLLNGDWDILSPPANVVGADALWPNSLALTIPWQAHEIDDPAVALCMGRIIRAFVVQGSAEGLDTSCLDALQPPIFDVDPVQ
jgi:pimeloyl-ACP methyl ester carboxylesterase